MHHRDDARRRVVQQRHLPRARAEWQRDVKLAHTTTDVRRKAAPRPPAGATPKPPPGSPSAPCAGQSLFPPVCSSAPAGLRPNPCGSIGAEVGILNLLLVGLLPEPTALPSEAEDLRLSTGRVGESLMTDMGCSFS